VHSDSKIRTTFQNKLQTSVILDVHYCMNKKGNNDRKYIIKITDLIKNVFKPAEVQHKWCTPVWGQITSEMLSLSWLQIRHVITLSVPSMRSTETH